MSSIYFAAKSQNIPGEKADSADYKQTAPVGLHCLSRQSAGWCQLSFTSKSLEYSLYMTQQLYLLLSAKELYNLEIRGYS